jgi:hypothetical protein
MPITSGGEQRLHTVAAAGIGGLTHPAVVSEQGLGATLCERVQLGDACFELRERLLDRTLADVARRVGRRARRQQGERVGSFERGRSLPVQASAVASSTSKVEVRPDRWLTSWCRRRRSATTVRAVTSADVQQPTRPRTPGSLSA